MTSTKVGLKSHDSENRLQLCSTIKKSHYPNTNRIYEKLDKLEEKFRLLEEEIDDLTDKALEIKWEIGDITKDIKSQNYRHTFLLQLDFLYIL
ncbi:hypothetical protein Glove_784g3 [Diversispora epigaea]|uniref:Uncharacterized protein n=1 Tax=Diversispora epigaea TaxID=1348612 RepID=A0A397G799_9GLOM|nr:hypothetical protein Glove_784g3 [Diversispora epigaea]